MMDRIGEVNVSANTLTFLGGVLFCLLITAAGFIATAVEIEDAKTARRDTMINTLRSARLLYSPGCFAYLEDNRPYPGIIDTDKVTDNRVTNCLERGDSSAPPLKANLYVNGSFEANATTTTWSSTPSTTLTSDSYTVSVDKEAVGVLEVYHK